MTYQPMIEPDDPRWVALIRAHTIVAGEVRQQAKWIIERGESPNQVIHRGLVADREAMVVLGELIFNDPAAIDAERLELADRALALPVRGELGVEG